MVTKKPREWGDDGAADAARHKELAGNAHLAANQTVAAKYDFGGEPPSTRGRSIPTANQVAAMKEHPEYEMWKDYRKEKD